MYLATAPNTFRPLPDLSKKKTAARFVMTENAPFRLSSLLLRCLSNLEKKLPLCCWSCFEKKKNVIQRPFQTGFSADASLLTDYFGAVKITRLKSGYELRTNDSRNSSLLAQGFYFKHLFSRKAGNFSPTGKKTWLKILTEQIFFQPLDKIYTDFYWSSINLKIYQYRI